MSDTPDAVGAWILNLITPIGELEPEVVLNADGTGSAVIDLGTVKIFDAAYDGDGLTFALAVVMPMGEFELTFAGTVSGDHLSGILEGSVGRFPVTGVRRS